MKHSTGIRVAAIAGTLLAAGLVTAGPANAAETHASVTPQCSGAARISSDQLQASILKAASQENPDAILATGPAGVAVNVAQA